MMASGWLDDIVVVNESRDEAAVPGRQASATNEPTIRRMETEEGGALFLFG
jgi:hypothetical protein